MPREIERKYIVNEIPLELSKVDGVRITQKYLTMDNDSIEIRIRSKGKDYYITLKRDQKGYRDEFEKKITNDEFNILREWARSSATIEKKRYHLPHGKYTLELDIFEGALEGLVLVEIEFPSLSDFRKFKPLSWFGKEVTFDKRYRNRNLSQLKDLKTIHGDFK